MENSIIVQFDLNTARKIKSGEIEGSVLIGNIKIEFVYESKDCADRYNLLFVKKDESGISAIYADTEGRTFFNNVLELEVEAGAYFKKGDVLISTLGNPFIYNGIINSVIRMLYSFRNGPKSGIKVADPEDNYEWTNKDGNEKYSTKNLPKAHFRWDWRRYTLSKESVDKITEFVDTILES